MADGDDILGSLPPTRVKWKMDDIKEATLEGSQFEAQFPEEKTTVPVGLPSPRPPTPKHPQTNSQTIPAPSNSTTNNRPKTTLRRTTSLNNVENKNSPPISRKSTQEMLSTSTGQYETGSVTPRKTSPKSGNNKTLGVQSQKKLSDASIGSEKSPAVSRKSTQELLITSSSQPTDSPKSARKFTVMPKKSGSASNNLQNNGDKNGGSYSDRTGTSTNRSEPNSRVSSQLSLNRPNSFARHENGNSSRSDLQRSRPNSYAKQDNGIYKPLGSAGIIQAKGRVMEQGWESLCLLSPSLIDSLDITLGQKLLLKDAVVSLRNMVDTDTPERKESTEPSAKGDNAQPGASGCHTKPNMRKSWGQLTLTFDGNLGPELSDSVDERAEEERYMALAVEEIDEKSKIYYSVLPGKMFDYHTAINNASKELCRSNPALLADRKKLFEKARKMVHEKGYSYKKKKSRSYDEPEPEKKRQKHVSSEIRVKRMNELSEDLSEVDVEIRLQTQQREKYKNINELNKAIGSTEKLSDLREKKRKLQSELTVLQLKDAKVKKAKKNAEKKKDYESKQPKPPITIRSFLKPMTEEKVKATEKKSEGSEGAKSTFNPEKNDVMEPDVLTPAREENVKATDKKTEVSECAKSTFNPEKNDVMEPDVLTPATEENVKATDKKTEVSEGAKSTFNPEKNDAMEPDVPTLATEDKVEVTEKKTEKKKVIDSENSSETKTKVSESATCAVDAEQNAAKEPDNFL